uniref:Peptidase A1 domain-containing protein n=1 Tax=Fagus sylvatica TaxID=28930 RepID=A0A2N9HBK3_FAGSY
MASDHSRVVSLAALAIVFVCSFCVIEALNGGFSVDLIHRDSPDSPLYNPSETPSQRIAKAVRRSINRVNHFKPASSLSPNAPVATMTSSNSGDYFMNYSIDPIFDPNRSRTYKAVACTSSQCESQDYTSCPRNETTCQYSMSYGDQSFTKGELAVDTLTLGSTTGRPVSIPKTIIGCGHNNDGTFSEQGSGIVGLGTGAVSLVSQLGSSIDGKFSYCLVPGGASGKLNFGSDAVVSGSGAVSTPFFSNDPDNFYFLTLEAMSVGSKRLELSNSSTSGGSEGNIIIDSGTTLTLLPEDFYPKFEAAVANQIDLEPTEDPSKLLSLCYNSKSVDIGAPSITAHFTGADVNLSPATTFIRVTEEVVCFAFLSEQSISIFGNLAQSDLLVGYDLVVKTVSFKPTDCTKF